MKQPLSALLLLCISSSVFAGALTSGKLSPANPVERPLTLEDGEIQISGALAYGEKDNNDNEWGFGANIGYGVTEDFTIDLSGLHYRFLAREKNQEGLELAASLGWRGQLESEQNGDADGYGIDINGKYVFSPDFAVTFGIGHIRWDEDKLEDKKEFDYSVGVQKRIFENVTLGANYTYRDLSDFTQDNAYQLSVSANYTVMPNLDVGVFYAKTDFDFGANGYKTDEYFRKGIGAYATYRF